MSVTWYGYLVDLVHVQHVYSSRDFALLDAVSHDFTRELRLNGQSYQAEIANGAPSLLQAVGELIVGSITSPQFAWQYGNAFHIICSLLGTKLPNDEFQMIHLPSSRNFTGKMEWVGQYMLSKPRYPIPLPPIEDFPLISYISKDEAANELPAQLLRNTGDGGQYTHEELMAAKQFEHWLYRATQEKRDIITFFE